MPRGGGRGAHWAPVTTTAPDLAAGLRLEVGQLRRRQARRLFAMRVALGRPGEPATTTSSGDVAPWRGAAWPPPSWVDAGVRFDVVDRLLGGHAGPGPVHAWLSRPGDPDLHDEDLAWLAASRHALAAHGLEPGGFWTVTRFGWLDPVSGESRRWKRLRLPG